MSKWNKIGETSQKVGWRWVTEKQFIDSTGVEQSFTTLGKPGARNIAVIALTKDFQIVTAKEFRVGPESVFYELPGGEVNSGEELEAAAFREFSEETGYKSDEPAEYLGKICRDAYTNEVNHYYFLTDCYEYRAPHPDSGELVDVALVSIGQLIDNAKNFRMSDSAGVFLAYDRLMEIQNAHK
jgi:ADP-ribose pyrophosphatase